MSDFLAKVCAESLRRAETGRALESDAAIRARAARRAPAKSLQAALAAPGRRFIAEVKRASPSKGDIARDLDAPAQAGAYQRGGAAAISVLTEPSHFHGSLDDLVAVAALATVPVLRKDFLVDPWQAWEARASGADAALLIVRALPGDRLARMYDALGEAGLEALVEVHDAPELERALDLGAPLIGVNARNLTTLAVDLANITALLPSVPSGVTAVAESGIGSLADVERLAIAGARCFLVGEALVRSGDPARTLREWSGGR